MLEKKWKYMYMYNISYPSFDLSLQQLLWTTVQIY